jgi:hypothetical protein
LIPISEQQETAKATQLMAIASGAPANCTIGAALLPPIASAADADIVTATFPLPKSARPSGEGNEHEAATRKAIDDDACGKREQRSRRKLCALEQTDFTR